MKYLFILAIVLFSATASARIDPAKVHIVNHIKFQYDSLGEVHKFIPELGAEFRINNRVTSLYFIGNMMFDANLWSIGPEIIFPLYNAKIITGLIKTELKIPH